MTSLLKKRVSPSKNSDGDKWPFFTPNTGSIRVFLSSRGPSGDASAICVCVYVHARVLNYIYPGYLPSECHLVGNRQTA